MERLGDKPRFWIHCASLGEFEQGRPIIESYRKAFPNHAIILSFFSPSGFEVRKNYAVADHVVYMPMDGKGAAKRFIQLVNPIRVVFVKYEYWYYYLHTLRKMGIPTILVSAAFRPDQVFFRWYGKFFQDILSYFTQIFVQDERSAQLLEGIGLKDRVSIAGDTRYDRVVDIASKAPSLPLIEAFKGNSALVIAGSTWPADENILHEVWRGFPNGWKLVIAPHEIDAAHIRELQR